MPFCDAKDNLLHLVWWPFGGVYQAFNIKKSIIWQCFNKIIVAQK